VTLVESRSSTAPAVEPPPDTKPGDRTRARAVARQRTTRIAVSALLVLLVAGGFFALFDGPIANAWYTTRQNQLASRWAASRPHVGRGNAVALLQIPKLNVSALIAEGDAAQQLRSGPGHRIGTPIPGEVGNSVVVGHASAWGGPFGALSTLQPGNLIVIQTKSSTGPIGVFKVKSVRKISGDDTGSFAPSTDRRLTLVTGSGGRFSDRRIVVTAISGPVGHLTAADTAVRATTSRGSPIWNADVGLASVALLAAAGLWWLLRRRYRVSSVLVVVTPFLALALLVLLLNLDASLPALR
jgi:sortase A